MNIRNSLTVAYFVLAFYGLGGGVMSDLVYYKSWKLVSVEDLPAVHHSVQSRILPYFAPFVFLLVLVNILLIWFHHPAMSTWLIVITAVLHLFILVVSFTVFLPIHQQLNGKLEKAKAAGLIDRMVKYDWYFRTIPSGSVVLIASVIMLYQVVNAS